MQVHGNDNGTDDQDDSPETGPPHAQGHDNDDHQR